MTTLSALKPWLARRAWKNSNAQIMLFVIVLAIAARLVVIFGSFPHIHWADESYKVFEPAHRMAFGYGLVVWEFRDGIVSPVLPSLLAGVWSVVEPVFGGPHAYLYAAQILLAALSLPAVVAVVRMGLVISRTHALIAGVAAASWYEIVYYAGRPLSEAVATSALLVGLALGSVAHDELTRSRLIAIGASFGLVLMLRVQLAPALLVAALIIARLNLRQRWWPIAVGAVVPVLVFATADWLHWGNPFSSTLNNVRVQLLENRASTFGVHPADWYLTTIGKMWGRWGWPILLVLAALRLRSLLLWIAVAAVIIATHSVIPHKEYRFVFPALACLVVAAAMGSADLVEKLHTRLGPRWRLALAAGVAVAWIIVSAVRPFSSYVRPNWTQNTDLLQATLQLPAIEELCGVLFKDFHASNGGAYAYIHRKVPIYGYGITQEPASRETYNAVVLKRASLPQLAPPFRLRTCYGTRGADDVCIMVRDGACKADPALRSTLDDPHI